jgi:lipopolysaccharide transport system ATP-binding protein
MEDIGRHGRTVFFVSHSMGALRTLCRRGIVLEHGVMVKDAPIEDAVEHYLDMLEAGAECRVADRKDRAGAGNLRMTDVEINDGNGGPPFILSTGRPARFCFRVEREAPALECMFRLFNHQGQLLANFDSRVHSADDVRETSVASKIVCDLDELQLMPGRYRIDASVQSNGIWEDGLEGAAYFTVVNGDLRGRPTAHNRKPASICLPHRWRVPSSHGSSRPS